MSNPRCLWCGHETEQFPEESEEPYFECPREGCTAYRVPLCRGMLQELDLWVAPVQHGPWTRYVVSPNPPLMETEHEPLWTGPFRVKAHPYV
jgi:hypothetical protein